MKKARLIGIGAVIIGLYIATALGTAAAYVRAEHSRAAAAYERAGANSERWRDSHVVVVPILPGISVVKSGYSAANVSAESSLKLVAWYVVGTIELLELYGVQA